MDKAVAAMEKAEAAKESAFLETAVLVARLEARLQIVEARLVALMDAPLSMEAMNHRPNMPSKFSF